MEHTKGKREIQGGTNAKGELFIWPAGFYYGGHAIATIHGDIQEGAEGNARLIAAAPDLLAACEDFAAGWSHFCGTIDFGKSFLDAEAIRFMNEVPGKIEQAAIAARGARPSAK